MVKIMSKHLVKKEKKDNSFFNKINKVKAKPELSAEKHINVEEADNKKHLNIPVGFGSGKIGTVIALLLLIAVSVCPIQGALLTFLYAVVLLVAILELIWDMLKNIQLKEYYAYENILLIAVLLAFCIGIYFEAVLIALSYRIIKLLYAAFEENSYNKIQAFSRIVPENANVESSEGILNLSPKFVNVGDVIVVGAGETIPLDGIIIEGISTIDTCSISGQSSSIPVTEGHKVYSGCRNISSSIRIKVTKPFDKSTAKSIVKLSESAAEYFSRQEKFSIIVKRYFPLAIFISAFVLFISLSVINGQWNENATRAVCILVCALSTVGLTYVSTGYLRTIGSACEKGIFVKGSDCIETLAKAETMVFDKTGIITEGRYVITDVFPNNVSQQQLLSMAATAERFSKHPIASVLRDAAGAIEIDYHSLQIEEIPGRGISAFVGEKQVYVGNTALLEEHGIKCAVPSRSGAAIHVAVDYKYWGHILISDRIRRGAFDSLEKIRANGVRKLVLLTGDVLSVAKPLASKLNFDMLRAELKPSEKVSAVDFLMANRGDSTTLAFVGDGNSDEQIMNRVDVGIALGALGSDAALSFADLLIMDRDIKKIPEAIKLSRVCYRTGLLNLLVWFAINAVIIVLSAIGLLPVLAVLIVEVILMFFVLINTGRIN